MEAGAHVLDNPEVGSRAIRGAALRTGSYVVGGLLALGSAPLLVRHLGVGGFGRYATVVSLIALVGGLSEAGLGPAGVREFAVLSGPERDRFMRDLLGLRLTLSSVGVVGATLFALAAGYDHQLVAGTVVARAGLLVGVTQGTFAIPLYAELRIGRQVAVELLTQIASVGLVLALVLVGAGLVPFLGVGAVTGLGLLAVTVVFVRGLMPLRPAFSVSRWREVLRQTLPVALGGAVHSLYFRSVILLMSLIAPEVQTGYFATSFRIVEVLLGIPVVLVSTTFPVLARAAHRDRARLAYATQQIAEIAVIGGVWMATGTAIGARIAIEVLAGRGADPSVPVLRVQAVTLLLAFISATSATALLSLRRQRELVVCSALALALTTGLTLALVPLEGARGAAIAATAGEAGLTLAFGLALRRSAGLRLTFGQLPRVLAAAAIAAGAALVPRWPEVVALVVFTAVYWALLAVTRTIPSDVRLALLAPFRRSAG